ncbi:uncharacterized protein ACRADG_004127 [Cochliomyia hominivorax]
MHFKVLSLFVCVAVVSADLLPETSLDNEDSHANYNFNYSVDDAITGDVKAQTETRDGDNVQGQYTLNDADGYKRIVDYTSDAVNGFKAVVRRERLQQVSTKTIKPQHVVLQPATVTPVKTTYLTPKPTTSTVIHHQPSLYHEAPHTVHIVHSSSSAALVKAAPTLITTTHHHTPTILHHSPTVVHHAPAAVVHHAPTLLKTSPHVSYVHYHH